MRRWLALTVVLAVFAAGGVAAWRRWERGKIFIETENAYVRGEVYTVASRIPGTLLSVEVEENARVAKGQTIATLDPRDYDSAVDRASATLAEAESALATDRAQIEQARAQVVAAESQLNLARIEEKRMRSLADRASIPRQKLDQAEAQAQVAAAQLVAARKMVTTAQAKLVVSERKIGTAKAALASAELPRSYTTVVAPVDGYVTRKSIEPGQVVAAGQPLCAIVPLDVDKIWIEANFKETQIGKLRPGQPVEIRVDVASGRAFSGSLESLSSGTGAAFALLPPENATGNWVKIVQRLPVRIRIDPKSDPEQLLRLGMSVSVVVDAREK
jgi:membrane fusion protein (multidrug efflux system)